ncbi:MAG TPA: response regulator transcription factor, partial [Thermoanaerobaculia bacterium]|nr:response regulator transcription factor [Thermoanaerobaculia bacterium]
ALRLAIVDHHQLFRDCLASVLSQDPKFEVLEKSANGKEVLGRLSEVDVLVLGLDSSYDGVLDLTREVCLRFPKVKVLILGREGSDDRILDCLEAGANGFLFRDQSLSELRSALEIVSRGDTVCAPPIVHSLFTRLADLGRKRRRLNKLEYLTLTPRELEILHLIADGLSNQEIAERLFLSVHTVKNHIHKVLETLGVRSRWAAVRHGVERGWIQDRRRR